MKNPYFLKSSYYERYNKETGQQGDECSNRTESMQLRSCTGLKYEMKYSYLPLVILLASIII